MQNASAESKRLGAAISLQLRRAIAPFFLRREKSLLQQASDVSTSDDATPIVSLSARKNDFAVWLPLSARQRQLYRAVIEAYHAQESKEHGTYRVLACAH